MNNVTATATDGTSSYGVYNISSSPTMTNVTATATGRQQQLRRVQQFDGEDELAATATGATNANFSIQTEGSADGISGSHHTGWRLRTGIGVCWGVRRNF